MTNTKPKRRNFFLISAILLVAFLFSYYFFAYIPGKENDMKNRGIRVMNRMVQNIQEKEAHYKKSIELFECNYMLAQIFETEADTSIIIDNLLYSPCILEIDGIEEILTQIDSIIDENYTYDGLYQYASLIEFQDSLLKHYGFLEKIITTLTIDPKVKFIEQKDSAKYLYTQALKDEINDDGYGWDDYKEWEEESIWKGYLFGIKANDFLSGIKRFEYFEDIFIVDPITNQVVDNSAKHLKSFYFYRGVKSTDTSKVKKYKTGELIDLSGVHISENNISNTNYYSYTTLVYIQEKPYYLTGLISKEKYNSQVRAVSVWVIMLSFVLLLFLVQILPIAKPFLLTKKERLHGSDMLWSAVAVIFGMAALVLFALSIDTFSIEEMDNVDNKLKLYANNIATEFKTETENALEILYDFSQDKISDNGNKNNVVNFIGNASAEVSLLGINSKGIATKYFKADAEGNLNEIKNEINLSHREYYKIHTSDNSRVWASPNNSKVETYFIESIYSLSSGTYETAISTKTDENSIWALVFPFHSVNNVYLEPNYSFCIIDESGTIHYHSDPSKIKNENFLDENSQTEEVTAFIRNTANAEFNLNFSLKDYRAHIEPIKNTTWFLVSLYDIQKSRLSVTTSMGITFQYILAIIFFMLVLHVIFRLQRMLGNKDGHNFSYNFLNPLTTLRSKYVEMSMVNGGLIVFLWFVYLFNDLDLLFNLSLYLISISLAIIYNYHLLISESEEELKTSKNKKWPFSPFENLLILSVVLWTIVFVNIIDSISFALYLSPLLAIVYLIYKNKRQLNFKENEKKNNTDEKYRPFYLHAFTWIILCSIIPTLMFFKPIYNHQQINRAKHYLQEEYNHSIGVQNWESKKAHLFNSVTYVDVHQNESTKILLDFSSIYMAGEKSHLEGIDKSENFKIKIQRGKDTTLISPFYKIDLIPNSAYYFQNNLEPNYVMAFSLPSILRHFSIKTWFFWLIILLALVTLYQTIVKISEKFFYLDFTRTLKGSTPEYFINDSKTKDIAIQDNEYNILIVGIPYSGRNGLAKKYLGKELKDVLRLDFLQDIDELQKEVFAKGNSDESKGKKGENKSPYICPILINNFDYRIFNFEHNIKKLEILEFILSKRNQLETHKKLILISSLDIYQIIEIYQENIKMLLGQGKQESDTTIVERRNAIDRWESVLFGFSKYIIPLKRYKNTHDNQGYIERELSFGNALKKLIPGVKVYKENLEKKPFLSEAEIEQKVIYAIQERAENYYFSIWNSCSKEEKFLLFDLAQDGLLNSTNTKAIENLVRRGILLVNPQLAIFNTSFAQFILESISEEESKQMEMEAKKLGTWSSYKYLVIFLVLVIVVFISFVEEQSFTKITGTVSLGAVLLPKVIRIVSAFSPKKRIVEG